MIMSTLTVNAPPPSFLLVMAICRRCLTWDDAPFAVICNRCLYKMTSSLVSSLLG